VRIAREPEIGELKCVECGAALEAVSDPEGVDEQPVPNEAFTMCTECGGIQMIGKDLKCRALTSEERTRLAHDRDTMRELRSMDQRAHFAEKPAVN